MGLNHKQCEAPHGSSNIAKRVNSFFSNYPGKWCDANAIMTFNYSSSPACVLSGLLHLNKRVHFHLDVFRVQKTEKLQPRLLHRVSLNIDIFRSAVGINGDKSLYS